MEKWKPWTMSEIDFIKQNYLFMSDKEIGEFLNRSCNLVKWQRLKLGLKKNKIFSEKEKIKVIKLYKEGYSQKQIALKLHVKIDNINYQIKKMRKKGIKIAKGINENFNYKYTLKEKKLIKELYPNSNTKKLAKLLKRSPQAIRTKASQMRIPKTKIYLETLRYELYKKWQKSWY